jgi:TonB family protein
VSRTTGCWVVSSSALALGATPPAIQLPPTSVPDASRPTSTLLEDLSSSQSAIRAGAVWRLADAEPSHPDLIAAVETVESDENAVVRYAAAWALGHLRGPIDSKASTPGVTVPRIAHQTRPRYPDPAFDKGITGRVLLGVLVGERGEVAHVAVVTAVPALDAAAVACVSQWRFEPLRVNDRPKAAYIHVPVTFLIVDKALPFPH